MRNNETNRATLVPIAVPLELLSEIGLEPMDAMQMQVVDERLIIEKLADDDFECDEDCENCPFEDCCDGNCGSCPCYCPCCEECIRELDLDWEDDYE